MLLSGYLSTLQNLIQAPTSPVPLINSAVLTQYINLGRSQVAMDAECVRGFATASVQPGVNEVAIAAMTSIQPGAVVQAIVIRNARINNTERVDTRSWDWFENYYYGGAPNPPVTGSSVMAHQGQGSYSTLFIYSQQAGQFLGDGVFLPVDLVDDTTLDAVPYPWTDAVPFYAAFYAYMTMQRQADAQAMLVRYYEMTRRGRSGVTSTALPENDPGGVGAKIANMKSTLAAPMAAPASNSGQQGG